MKCVITGHTSGIGKALYDHFKNKGYEVIGLSRSNGYDISTNQDSIVELASGCDIFVNNAYHSNCQTQLLDKLHNKVKNIIVVGSVAADWARVWKEYGEYKEELQIKAKELSLLTTGANILYLKLAFCENASWPENLDSKYKATFNEIVKAIDLWIEVPKIFSIEFALKVTDEIMSYAKKMNPHD